MEFIPIPINSPQGAYCYNRFEDKITNVRGYVSVNAVLVVQVRIGMYLDVLRKCDQLKFEQTSWSAVDEVLSLDCSLRAIPSIRFSSQLVVLEPCVCVFNFVNLKIIRCRHWNMFHTPLFRPTLCPVCPASGSFPEAHTKPASCNPIRRRYIQESGHSKPGVYCSRLHVVPHYYSDNDSRTSEGKPPRQYGE